MWNFTKCCFQGTKSIYQEEYMQNNALICQDFVDFTINKEGDYIGALSDGASSAHLSLIGAQCNVNAILKIFHRYTFDEFYSFSNDKQEKIILESCINEISFFNNKIDNSNLSDFSATLLFIVTNRKKMIFGHIGDGIICALKNNDEVELLSGPYNKNNNVNITSFTVDTLNKEFVKKIDNIDDYKAFYAMSDGFQKGFYNEIENRVLSVNLKTIYYEILQKKFIEMNLLNFLKQSFWEINITNDDCSMFVIYNDNEEISHNNIIDNTSIDTNVLEESEKKSNDFDENKDESEIKEKDIYDKYIDNESEKNTTLKGELDKKNEHFSLIITLLLMLVFIFIYIIVMYIY